MSNILNSEDTGVDFQELSSYLDDEIIEEIWRDFDGRVDRGHIRRVATEVIGEFSGATITNFIPIFLQRITRERLRIAIQEADI
jgi:hypothetical protein